MADPVQIRGGPSHLGSEIRGVRSHFGLIIWGAPGPSPGSETARYRTWLLVEHSEKHQGRSQPVNLTLLFFSILVEIAADRLTS